jgi:hypothetical protein
VRRLAKIGLRRFADDAGRPRKPAGETSPRHLTSVPDSSTDIELQHFWESADDGCNDVDRD